MAGQFFIFDLSREREMDDAAVSSLYDRQDETADALSAHIRIIVPERKTPKGGEGGGCCAGLQACKQRH